MKRIALACLAVCAFLLLGILIARESQPTQGQQGGSQNAWISKGDGVFFQLVSGKDEWPEIGVLKLTNDAYASFSQSPAKFINNHSLFSRPVIDPSPASVSLNAPQDPAAAFYYAVISHGHMSTTYTAAVPAPAPPPTPKR